MRHSGARSRANGRNGGDAKASVPINVANAHFTESHSPTFSRLSKLHYVVFYLRLTSSQHHIHLCETRRCLTSLGASRGGVPNAFAHFHAVAAPCGRHAKESEKEQERLQKWLDLMPLSLCFRVVDHIHTHTEENASMDKLTCYKHVHHASIMCRFSTPRQPDVLI